MGRLSRFGIRVNEMAGRNLAVGLLALWAIVAVCVPLVKVLPADYRVGAATRVLHAELGHLGTGWDLSIHTVRQEGLSGPRAWISSTRPFATIRAGTAWRAMKVALRPTGCPGPGIESVSFSGRALPRDRIADLSPGFGWYRIELTAHSSEPVTLSVVCSTGQSAVGIGVDLAGIRGSV